MLNTSYFNKQRIGVLIIVFLVSVNVSFVLYNKAFNFGYGHIDSTDTELVTELAIEKQDSVADVVVDDSATVTVSTQLANNQSVKNSKHSYGVYVVREGDSLYWIAERYDSTVDELKKLNGLTTDILRPSQALVVPTHIT